MGRWVTPIVGICFLLGSCAELRLQPVIRSAYLSQAGDSASLAKLQLLDRDKTTQGNEPQFGRIEPGTEVFATDYSTERCRGRRVFERVEVRSGSHKGIMGWMCGASIAHRKVPAL